jgi:hypothetical protein
VTLVPHQQQQQSTYFLCFTVDIILKCMRSVQMQHVRSAARGRIDDVSKVNQALCKKKRVCYSKRNSEIRLNATLPCIKSVHSGWTWTSRSLRSKCPQQLKEFFADEITQLNYQWDACCMSQIPEQVALGKTSYQDGVTFCGTFKVSLAVFSCIAIPAKPSFTNLQEMSTNMIYNLEDR